MCIAWQRAYLVCSFITRNVHCLTKGISFLFFYYAKFALFNKGYILFIPLLREMCIAWQRAYLVCSFITRNVHCLTKGISCLFFYYAKFALFNKGYILFIPLLREMCIAWQRAYLVCSFITRNVHCLTKGISCSFLYYSWCALFNEGYILFILLLRVMCIV